MLAPASPIRGGVCCYGDKAPVVTEIWPKKNMGENFVARRSESLDAEKISEMVSRQTESIFGRTDVEMEIEYANLSVTLVGVEDGEILGHIALMDYPNLTSVDQSTWENWIHTNFNVTEKSTPVNSLFMHLFVAKEGFAQAAAAELLRASFMTISLLQYIYLTTTTSLNLGSGLGYHMEKVARINDGNAPVRGGGVPVIGAATPNLYVAHRHEHFPMLHVRTARVEDTDDLMPVFTQSSEAGVDQQYGEFFLAELIESQDEHHKTIVADVNGVAVGFLSVTTVVDVDHLHTSYQLEVFHGLKQADDQDEAHTVSTSGSKRSSTTGIQTNSSEQTQLAPGSDEKVSTHVLTTLISTQEGGADHHNHIFSASSSTCSQELHDSSQTSSHEAPKSQSAGSEQGESARPVKETSPVIPTVRAASITPQGSAAGSVASGKELNVPEDSNIAKEISADSALSSQKSSVDDAGLGGVPDDRKDSSYVAGGEAKTEDPTSSASKKKVRKQYFFKGEGSALAVQLFAIDEKYEMRSMDLLPMVFKLFPDHNFLVLSQPHSMPEFPLLSQFTRILPRPGIVVPQDLYVLHKYGLLHNFSVRPVCSSDTDNLARFVHDLNGSTDLLLDTQRYLDAKRDPLSEGSTPLYVLVAECSGQLVGVCVIRDEEDIRYIRTHYNIEYFVYFDYHPPSSHAHLHHFILSPVFHSYAKFFLKECLRLSHKSCLYYPLYPGLEMETTGRPHSIMTALAHMVPIKARPQVVYEMGNLDVCTPLEDVVQKKAPYSLYHTNRKLAYEPKIHVNARVVVVGASDTAISFLETFLFSPHLHFTNLTLLSPHSFPATDPFSATSAHHITSHALNYTQSQYDLLGLDTWVNTVRGKLVALDRPEQCLYVDCGERSCLLYYDYLVLCMGTQYLPGPELGSNLYRQSNIFTINDLHDSQYLQQWIKHRYFADIRDNIFIYGNSLDTFSVLQAVLDAGVSPRNVVLACPGGKCALSPVPKANDILQGAMISTGIQVIDEVTLTHCEVKGKKLASLQFSKKDGSALALTAQALIYVDQKAIDPEAFKALNDACLVMDRQLVISTNYETNDPLIFAAGPLTKFSRRYRAEQWSHADYNSKEVGERLASTLLSKFDPTLAYFGNEERSTVEVTKDILLPIYTQPKVKAAYLPGGYYYLYFHTPISTPPEDQDTSSTEPVTMSTETDSGFMHLHLDKYGCVDELVACSREPLPAAHNYLCLYHMHEKYLNNMLQRWNDGLIEDFFSYFKEPWTCAIFHDRFTDLVEEVNEHMHTVPLEDGGEESLHALVQRMVTEDNARSRVSLEDVSPIFNKSGLKEGVEKKLYKFLAYNIHHLPMYISPDCGSMNAR